MKITINNEEVLCDKNIKITEEMLNTSSTILNNVYPKTWETTHDYTQYYYPKDYSQCLIWTDKLRDASFNGYCKQEQENLFNGFSFTKVSSGITFTYYEDGSIKANGTSTANAFSMITSESTPYRFELQPGTYLIGSGLNNVQIQVINSSGTNIGETTSSILVKPFTITSAMSVYVRLFISSGKTVNDLILKPVLTKLLSSENPVEVKTLTGNTTVGVPTKNLLQVSDKYITNNGITANINDGIITLYNTATSNSFINVLPAQSSLLLQPGTYTISANNSVGVNGATIRLMKSDGSTVISDSACSMANANGKKTFTLNDTFIGFLQIRTASGTTYNTFTFKPQIERGSTATTYEKYTLKSYNLNLGDIELCNVNGYKDVIYNVGENWYLYKTVGKTTLNGTENWVADGSLTNNARYKINNFGYYQNMLCDHFWYYANYNSDYEHFYTSSGNDLLVFISKTTASTVANFKTWLQDNNVDIYYVMSTHTITQITDENLIDQLNVLIKDLLFSGVAKRTGNISLNPFHAHYCDLQVLDYKTLLSEGDTLDFVIADKTVEEAIDMVIDSVKDYGFIKGNISIPDNFLMGTYNTQEKTAYDVFQYISDITQTKWTTRVINQDTVAIDFYNPYDKTPVGTIESTQNYFKDNNIIDITYNYSTEDYRNKQVMTSNEVVSSITQTFRVYADGVNKTFDIGQTIGDISYAYYTTSTDFVICDVITKAEQEQGYSGDIIYTPGETTFETDDKLANGVAITLEINLLVPGRQIALNEPEISRIATQNNRKGVISRYENRDDTKSSVELQRIAQSYIEYKGKAEITLTVQTQNVRLCEIGDIMIYNSSLSALNDNYMCKKIDTEMIMTTGDIFYTFEFSNTYNTENAINYFDNQRNKTLGNISDGQTITRNLDIENTLDIVFFDTEVS